MGSRVVIYIIVLCTIDLFMSNNMIDHVSGQCTVQGCEKEDSSNGITPEIQEIKDFIILNLQAVDRRSQEQIQNIYEFLNMSYQQIKNQFDTVMINFQAIDRRLQEQDTYIKQIENNHEILNASHQEIKNLNATIQKIKDQQDIAMTSLQAIDRSSKEHVHSIKFLNTSIQQMGNQQETVMTSLRATERRSLEQSICLSEVQSISEFLNASCQQMQNQQLSAMTSLVAIDRLLNEHDIFVRNKTEIILEQTNTSIIRDWIVIMNRFNGSVDFNRNWTEYSSGFGDKAGGEFWLGNEEIHSLTNRFNCILRIEMQLTTSGQWYYAEYSNFSLDSEDNKYTLHVSGYSGNAGDSLTNNSAETDRYLGEISFTTRDNDNDRWSGYNCAHTFLGGWWYNGRCYHYYSCLTCNYQHNFRWHYPTRNNYWPTTGHLRAARMKIKSK